MCFFFVAHKKKRNINAGFLLGVHIAALRGLSVNKKIKGDVPLK